MKCTCGTILNNHQSHYNYVLFINYMPFENLKIIVCVQDMFIYRKRLSLYHHVV